MPYAPSRKTVYETPWKCYGSTEITCPHCDHEHTESYTFHEEEHHGFDMTCEECDKSFWVVIEYSVEYYSWAYADENKKDTNAEQPDSARQEKDSETKVSEDLGQPVTEGRSSGSISPA
jgi:transcription elongation factor Elf1